MKKKTNFTLKNMVTSMCERNIPFGKNFFLHFRTPKRILKNNMPFGVPVHAYMEELQPCLTGLFQGNERYLKN